MRGRDLMLVNSLFRLGYGAAALLAPEAVAVARLAADTAEQPEARLFVRGFGAHQLAVGALGLAGRRRPELERTAALLAVAIDAVDMVSALAEGRARGRLDADVLGGLVLSAAGAATAAATALSR